MLDKKYNSKEKEQKWLEYWETNNVYKFERDNKNVYSIDTPPPTVSGKIHIGHIFSYSQAEVIARYKRMQGYNVLRMRQARDRKDRQANKADRS